MSRCDFCVWDRVTGISRGFAAAVLTRCAAWDSSSRQSCFMTWYILCNAETQNTHFCVVVVEAFLILLDILNDRTRGAAIVPTGAFGI